MLMYLNIMSKSIIQRLAELPEHERREFLDGLDPQILDMLVRQEWFFTARPEQVPPPGDWSICLMLAGRGFGKTRSGAEWIVQRTLDHPFDSSGFPTERLIMAFNISDAVASCAEGPSGVIRVLQRMGYEEVVGNRKIETVENKYSFTKSPKPYVRLLETGAVIHFTGATIDAARSKNLADVWLDEPIKWAAPEETWREGIRPALRADIPGDKPRALVTTTPKPIMLLKNWVTDPVKWKVAIVRGSTFDNAVNLSEDAVEELRQVYEGTALGRQELYGELLDDITGALFNWASINDARRDIGPAKVAHRTVGVDPGLTGDEDGDEMGVVVVSRDFEDDMWVVADETTRLAGRDAALHAWRVFERYHCDTLVYESNLGKAWMQDVFTDAFRELQRAGVFPSEIMTPPLVPVFSNLGKKLRAEPVAMRYSQGRVHHIGTFDKLETQMLTFDPLSSKASPDRLDALVHAARHLIEGERRRTRILSPLGRSVPSLGFDQIGRIETLGDYGIR
jgi:phage terminase large subunit-like protein